MLFEIVGLLLATIRHLYRHISYLLSSEYTTTELIGAPSEYFSVAFNHRKGGGITLKAVRPQRAKMRTYGYYVENGIASMCPCTINYHPYGARYSPKNDCLYIICKIPRDDKKLLVLLNKICVTSEPNCVYNQLRNTPNNILGRICLGISIIVQLTIGYLYQNYNMSVIQIMLTGLDLYGAPGFIFEYMMVFVILLSIRQVYRILDLMELRYWYERAVRNANRVAPLTNGGKIVNGFRQGQTIRSINFRGQKPYQPPETKSF